MSPKRIMWWAGSRFFDRLKEDMMYLKPFRQTPDYCGPAVAKMYLHYLGVDVSVQEIAKIAGTTKKEGTSISGMVKVFEHYGFKTFSKQNSALDDLRFYINSQIPVIVDWFCEDDGHYSIVIGMDKKHVFFRDPSFWKVRKMPIDKFFRVWFDFPGNYIKESKNLILRWMLVATPPK